MNKSFTTLIFIPLLLASNNLYAALYDRGNGLIFDSVLNITWLQDTDFAVTSGFIHDGYMTHTQATQWVEGLVYQNADNWRLPSVGHNPNWGFGNTTSELGYMYYENLSLSTGDGFLSNPMPFTDSGSGDTISFYNMKHHLYHMSEISQDDESSNWMLNSGSGGQVFRSNRAFAWAVHDGDIANSVDVAAVPVPASAFLFGSALLGLMVTRRQTNP